MCIMEGDTGNVKYKILSTGGRRGGSVVSASDLGPEGREFEPWPSPNPRSVLRQNT